jgi:hypothetical protein
MVATNSHPDSGFLSCAVGAHSAAQRLGFWIGVKWN